MLPIDEAVDVVHQIAAERFYETLDSISDDLYMIKRLFEKPPGAITPELLDVIRLALANTTGRAQGLAFRMRTHEANQTF